MLDQHFSSVTGFRSFVLLGLLACGACQPCAGVAECSESPTLRVTGRVVTPVEGNGVGGVEIRVGVDGTFATSLTDRNGEFSIALGVGHAGPVDYDLTVSAPGSSPWSMRRQCVITTVHGDGCPLAVLNAHPIVRWGGFVSFRGGNHLPVPAAPGIFHRTGGSVIQGDSVARDSVRIAIDGGDAGHINLFNRGVDALDTGHVVGDLTFHLGGTLDTASAPNVAIPVSVFFNEPIPPLLIAIGPSLRSRAFFVRADGKPAAGVHASFVPESGITLTEGHLEGISADSGFVEIDPRPLARGVVTGRLEVDASSAGGSAFVVHDIVLATADSSGAAAIGVWSVNGTRLLRADTRTKR